MSEFDQDILPGALVGGDAAACVTFAPAPFSQGVIQGGDVSSVAEPQEIGRRICILWFLDRDPREGGATTASEFHHRVSTKTVGELRLSAEFVPTVPGTDTYVSELR
jgi:hypothetical protein